jgi:hypothetical protein
VAADAGLAHVAAHDREARDPPRQVGIERDGARDVRERPDRHELELRHLAREAHDRLRGALGGDRRVRAVRQPAVLDLAPDEALRPEHGLVLAHEDGHVGPAREAEQPRRCGRAPQCDPRDARHADETQLRRGEQHAERERVVDVGPDVRVEEDGPRHLRPRS